MYAYNKAASSSASSGWARIFLYMCLINRLSPLCVKRRVGLPSPGLVGLFFDLLFTTKAGSGVGAGLSTSVLGCFFLRSLSLRSLSRCVDVLFFELVIALLLLLLLVCLALLRADDADSASSTAETCELLGLLLFSTCCTQSVSVCSKLLLPLVSLKTEESLVASDLSF